MNPNNFIHLDNQDYQEKEKVFKINTQVLPKISLFLKKINKTIRNFKCKNFVKEAVKI